MRTYRLSPFGTIDCQRAQPLKPAAEARASDAETAVIGQAADAGRLVGDGGEREVGVSWGSPFGLPAQAGGTACPTDC